MQSTKIKIVRRSQRRMTEDQDVNQIPCTSWCSERVARIHPPQRCKTFFFKLNEPSKFTNSKVTLCATQFHHQKCIHYPFYLLVSCVYDTSVPFPQTIVFFAILIYKINNPLRFCYDWHYLCNNFKRHNVNVVICLWHGKKNRLNCLLSFQVNNTAIKVVKPLDQLGLITHNNHDTTVTTESSKSHSLIRDIYVSRLVFD